MDMNELLRQHQIALINAENGHFGGTDHGFRLVHHYARRIARLRTELGVPQY
jgi:hypothetical protein